MKVKAGALCMGMRRCGMKQISCRRNYVSSGRHDQNCFYNLTDAERFCGYKKIIQVQYIQPKLKCRPEKALPAVHFGQAHLLETSRHTLRSTH